MVLLLDTAAFIAAVAGQGIEELVLMDLVSRPVEIVFIFMLIGKLVYMLLGFFWTFVRTANVFSLGKCRHSLNGLFPEGNVCCEVEDTVILERTGPVGVRGSNTVRRFVLSSYRLLFTLLKGLFDPQFGDEEIFSGLIFKVGVSVGLLETSLSFLGSAALLVVFLDVEPFVFRLMKSRLRRSSVASSLTSAHGDTFSFSAIFRNLK